MDKVRIGGRERDVGEILDPWLTRSTAAKADRKRYEPQWMTSQHFAAGKQWAAYVGGHDHRMILPVLPKGRSRQTSDRLTQYVMTVVGQLASDEFQPQLLLAHDDAQAQDYAELINKALTYGWEHEWAGDRKVLALLRILVVLGTGGIRCRYDKTLGPVRGEFPHQDGQPILDPAEGQKYTADKHFYGEDADLRSIRQGRICWDVLSPWNLLPPPGIEYPEDFPWELIVRPVHIEQLKAQYGERAQGVQTDSVEAMDMLGMQDAPAVTGSESNDRGAGKPGKLEDHALVYTGYLKPQPDWPEGQSVTFTGSGTLLDAYPSMPYPATSAREARSGITYFRYWVIPGRFMGRGLIEPGIGPQRLLNKRASQIDEIIDRGLPKAYVQKGALVEAPRGLALEIVELNQQHAPTIDSGVQVGAWMYEDIRMLDESIEKALGVRGVSLGDNPPGVTTYSQLALMRETDSDKIDPIAADLKLGLADVTYDSVESMRNWPPDKTLMIAGEDDTLEVFTFDKVTLPAEFMVLPAKGGAQLRSQGAELQKVRDIWDAALKVGRGDLFDWYVASTEAGKAQELPPNPVFEAQHYAALENALLARGQQVPVAAHQDPNVHIPEHRAEQDEWIALAEGGHPDAAQVVQVFEEHIQQHLASAQQNAASAPQSASPQPSPAA